MNCIKSILYKNRFLFAYFTIMIIKNDRILLYFKKKWIWSKCLPKKKKKEKIVVCSLWKLVRDRTFIQWREASPTLWKSSFPVVEQDAITQPFFLTCRSPLGKSTRTFKGGRVSGIGNPFYFYSWQGTTIFSTLEYIISSFIEFLPIARKFS